MVIRRFGQSFCWQLFAGIPRLTAIFLIFGLPAVAMANRFVACQAFPSPQDPATSPDSIPALVSQLGSDDYLLRESAESELLKIGGPAIGFVREAQASGNSEIRFRAYRLLPLLKRAEMANRLQEFIDKGVADPPEIFADWTAFSQIAGNDKTARELFAAISKASPELFENLRSDPNIARFEYIQLINSLNRSRFRSLSAATVLFLDTVDFDGQPDRTQAGDSKQLPDRIWTNSEALIRTGENLKNQNAISFIETSGYANQFRKLIENWIDSLPSDDNHLLETKLGIIEAYRLTDRLPALIKTAANEFESIQSRAKAIAIVAKLGGPAEINSLLPFLDNESMVGHFAGMRDEQLLEVQLRDVALAACVYLSGQKMKQFGFDPNPHRQDSFLSLSRAGFVSKTDREEAFQKWKQYYQDKSPQGHRP